MNEEIILSEEEKKGILERRFQKTLEGKVGNDMIELLELAIRHLKKIHAREIYSNHGTYESICQSMNAWKFRILNNREAVSMVHQIIQRFEMEIWDNIKNGRMK
jgi:hypothetical protein